MTLPMNLLIFLGLAGLILINACSDNPANSNEDLSSSGARDQLLEKVSKTIGFLMFFDVFGKVF